MEAVALDRITKIYNGGVLAVDDVCLKIDRENCWSCSGHRGAARPRSCALSLAWRNRRPGTCRWAAILQFLGTPGLGVVHLGGASGGVCLEIQEDFAIQARVFEQLRAFALSPAQSALMLRGQTAVYLRAHAVTACVPIW